MVELSKKKPTGIIVVMRMESPVFETARTQKISRRWVK